MQINLRKREKVAVRWKAEETVSLSLLWRTERVLGVCSTVLGAPQAMKRRAFWDLSARGKGMFTRVLCRCVEHSTVSLYKCVQAWQHMATTLGQKHLKWHVTKKKTPFHPTKTKTKTKQNITDRAFSETTINLLVTKVPSIRPATSLLLKHLL